MFLIAFIVDHAGAGGGLLLSTQEKTHMILIIICLQDPPPPYTKSLGPDSYLASVGLEFKGSISWRQANEAGKESSYFQSQEPRFKDIVTTTGESIGPGKYEDIRLPSCADIKDEGHGNFMFTSKVPLVGKKKMTPDNRDTAPDPEVEKSKFWNRGGNVWTKNPRSKMGPRLCTTGCGPEVVMYDIDSTRVVSKYVPLAKAAGCDKVALPPRGKRSGNSPRSKFLVDQSTASATPLDLSFLQLETASDIARALEELQITSSKKERDAPTDSNNNSTEQEQTNKSPPTSLVPKEGTDTKSKMKIRLIVKSVRLNNNQLKSTEGLQGVLAPAIDSLEGMGWIDLAFNKLTHIVIQDFMPAFQNLSVLNLDNNDIHKLTEINKLAQFPNLTSLTLHSNPVALSSNYRAYVISSLPQLKKLDSSIVTPKERERAIMWRSKLKKEPMNFGRTHTTSLKNTGGGQEHDTGE